MARAAVPGRLGDRRLTWQPARLLESRAENAGARSLVFAVPGWPGHLPGQHTDVRLTAPDGYSTERSYSLAAPAVGDLARWRALTRARGRGATGSPSRGGYPLRPPGDRSSAGRRREPAPGDNGVKVPSTSSRAAPPGWARPPGRLMAADLAAAGWPPPAAPACFGCGPTGFVEAAPDILVRLGHAPGRIKAARFGPTGGCQDATAAERALTRRRA